MLFFVWDIIIVLWLFTSYSILYESLIFYAM